MKSYFNSKKNREKHRPDKVLKKIKNGRAQKPRKARKRKKRASLADQNSKKRETNKGAGRERGMVDPSHPSPHSTVSKTQHIPT